MPNRTRWAAWGDLNAFFGLMLDNVTNLVLLSAILVGFDYPTDILYSRMIPGTAFGVLVGDLLYTWMAVRLAKRTGRSDVTAMPLGLDTPSTIGMAVAVLGPCYLQTGDALLTWKVGMAAIVAMGLLKTLLSFFGDRLARLIPQAGLLGSLAGVGVALLGFLPLLHIFDAPIVGLVALGVLLYAVVARLPLPGRLPGVFAAVALGAAFHYGLGSFGLLEHFTLPSIAFRVDLPLPTLGFLDGLGEVVGYLPIALPLGLLTVVGGINVTESARVAGDDYRTRDVLLAEAVATLAAGLTGGVAQSTPYIGHPAYKKMGGAGGLHARDRPVHRARRRLWLGELVRRDDPSHGGGSGVDLRRPGDHLAGLRGEPPAARRGRGLRVAPPSSPSSSASSSSPSSSIRRWPRPR